MERRATLLPPASRLVAMNPKARPHTATAANNPHHAAAAIGAIDAAAPSGFSSKASAAVPVPALAMAEGE
jgi:hypothetical protein